MSKRVLKLLVTGDSWAAGEYTGQEHLNYNLDRIKKHSTAKYLEKYGHDVDHLPFVGKSDIPVLDFLDLYFTNYDYIIVFKTSTMRAFKYYNFFKEYELKISKTLTDKLDLVSREIYRRFSTYKDKLIMIGGVEKIKKPYDYFYTVPSICELIDPSFNDCEHFIDLRELKFTDVASDKKGYKKHILDYEEKMNFMTNSKYFRDNRHPNRYVHGYLAKLINDQLQK